jgi:hypothetical protein
MASEMPLTEVASSRREPASPSCPLLFSPQHLTPPVSVTAHAWLAPTEIKSLESEIPEISVNPLKTMDAENVPEQKTLLLLFTTHVAPNPPETEVTTPKEVTSVGLATSAPPNGTPALFPQQLSMPEAFMTQT